MGDESANVTHVFISAVQRKNFDRLEHHRSGTPKENKVIFPVQLATAQDYYGVYVGKLRNASYALEGDVYLVNSTHLQIVDFTIKRLVGGFS
ncbi:hypothetical protein ANCDUO_18116 [Ancylostoma duodenale]|uniref:Uncharacterized protein n=1 Tax=Ancylostoma duodenale TaxID=51022 RepID=A0A0C2G430_9BILA|nr:hypothetical protein ANCDUO_18116 [Ancylostoma duodenale]